ncbi:hypothetical protein BTM25_31010 [Actinomadura rubteroloni]|uniref:Uncharacterized protein n=1 Tax=Actinomadura rubteroloni TaxID=1926885 RepID=A0A2P4UHD8_9ACTN|nr:hypothetical protein [Actinomadura rubteroloni]POM24472.1 hypothetical protein BTM25_31010 [Actinomadura rubteroloni]
MNPRARGLVALLAAGAVLVVGWPLLSRALGSSAEPLRDGSRLTLGSGTTEARFAVGPGWSLRKSGSDPAQSYKLERAGTDLAISLVAPPAGTSPGQLWEGLRDVVRIGDPDARLGVPRPYRDGLSGPLQVGADLGSATVLPHPDGTAAVEATVLGGSPDDLDAAARVVGSLRFTGTAR